MVPQMTMESAQRYCRGSVAEEVIEWHSEEMEGVEPSHENEVIQWGIEHQYVKEYRHDKQGFPTGYRVTVKRGDICDIQITRMEPEIGESEMDKEVFFWIVTGLISSGTDTELYPPKLFRTEEDAFKHIRQSIAKELLDDHTAEMKEQKIDLEDIDAVVRWGTEHHLCTCDRMDSFNLWGERSLFRINPMTIKEAEACEECLLENCGS